MFNCYKTNFQQKKTPILFIHGYLETESIWENYIAYFIKERDCITYTLPGHKKKETVNFSWESICTEIEKELNNQPFILCTHSLGGYISFELLKRKKAEIKSVICFQTTYRADSLKRKKKREKTIFALKNNPELLFHLAFKKYQENPTFNYNKAIQLAKNMNLNALIYWQELLIKREDYLAIVTENKDKIVFVLGENDQEFRDPIDSCFNQFTIKNTDHLLPDFKHQSDWFLFIKNKFID